MFLLPIGTLLHDYYATTSTLVDSSVHELQGLTYVKSLQGVIAEAQTRREYAITESPELAASQSKVSAAFDKLQATDQALRKDLDTAESFAKVQKLHQALLTAPKAANAQATFEAHNELIDALVALNAHIADSSELALDPELDTFHLMNYGVLYGVQQMENVSELSVLGWTALKAGKKEGFFDDRINQNSGVLRFVDGIVENSYLRATGGTPEADAKYDMKANDEAYDAFVAATAKQLLTEPLSGDADAYLQLGKASLQAERSLNGKILQHLEDRLNERIANFHQGMATRFGISAFFVALAFYMLLAFYKVMMGGLREVTGHLEQITQGNLVTAPTPWGKDEAAHLMITLRDMEGSLRVIVRNTLDGAGNVNTASEEIAHASQDLSRRTEASAAALEQTAATMTQISETVQRTSATVEGASDIVRSNADAATRGGEVIAQVVQTMQGINAASTKIADIISVIDGIAFQTNILALNAAVEAARAGEQGRGFAVVAGEVRVLAQRSAAAAKDIRQLTVDSVDRVASGASLIRQAENTLNSLGDAVLQVDQLLSEVSQVTREQSGRIQSVTGAIGEIDQNTQQNAAIVEQAAAAADALQQQSARLVQTVRQFVG